MKRKRKKIITIIIYHRDQYGVEPAYILHHCHLHYCKKYFFDRCSRDPVACTLLYAGDLNFNLCWRQIWNITNYKLTKKLVHRHI